MSNTGSCPGFVQGVQMPTRAYILVQARVGQARAVAVGIERSQAPGAHIIAADTVTGPYDVIVQLEADDFDRLADAVSDLVQNVAGVQRTITCVAVRLA